jgi:hypothetical protein
MNLSSRTIKTFNLMVGHVKNRMSDPISLVSGYHEGRISVSNIVHQSHITITRENGPTRKAVIRGFQEPIYYGVHGGIKDFYRVEPEEEHAATLDHVVGAVGG